MIMKILFTLLLFHLIKSIMIFRFICLNYSKIKSNLLFNLIRINCILKYRRKVMLNKANNFIA